MQNKNIWVFHHYATPPSKSGMVRPFNFAKYLKKDGYNTTVFSASYLHYSDINLIDDNNLYIEEVYDDVKFVYVRTPSSAKGTISRIKNMLMYYINLFRVTKKYLKTKNEHPDVIYASSPHPLALIAGVKISKKLNIPNVTEIRDLWPEAIFAFGKAKENSLLGRILIAGEYWIYKKSKALVFLKEGDIDYLKERKWIKSHGGLIDQDKCFYINNGVEVEEFTNSIKIHKLSDNDLDTEKFNVVYTGAIRPLNNVGNILDAAKLLLNKEEIQFLIYGDGSQIESLKKRVVDEKITNVKIKGYIDKKYIPFVLSKSSVNILNYSQSKYNWSRGNSSNKLFEYMASGKPIISTVNMGYSPISKYECGISLESDTAESLSKAILEIYNLPKSQYQIMSDNARVGASNFDYKELTRKFVDVLERITND